MGIVWNIQINCLPLQSKQEKWSLGRVVRRRSAKPFTAVRIRQRPQVKSRNPSLEDYGIFVWVILVHSEV